MRYKGRKLEAEVTELHPKHASLVLCAWFDESQAMHFAYLRVESLELVKSTS